MPAIAIRLKNGLYRIGNRCVSYRKAQLIAYRRGARWLEILDDVTRNLVDYVDLA